MTTIEQGWPQQQQLMSVCDVPIFGGDAVCDSDEEASCGLEAWSSFNSSTELENLAAAHAAVVGQQWPATPAMTSTTTAGGKSAADVVEGGGKNVIGEPSLPPRPMCGGTSNPPRVRFTLGQAEGAETVATTSGITSLTLATGASTNFRKEVGTGAKDEAAVGIATPASASGKKIPEFQEWKMEEEADTCGEMEDHHRSGNDRRCFGWQHPCANGNINGEPAARARNGDGRAASAAFPSPVHNYSSSSNSSVVREKSWQWEGSTSADQLIALTATPPPPPPPPHNPVRLFLYRSRPDLSHTTAEAARGKSSQRVAVEHCDRGEVGRAGAGILGEMRGGRINVGARNRQAFPLPWASVNPSPMGTENKIIEQVHVGRTPSARVGRKDFGTGAAPAWSTSSGSRSQHQRRVDGIATNGNEYSPRWHSTSRKTNPENSNRRSSSIANNHKGGHSTFEAEAEGCDENTPPACLSRHARRVSEREAPLSLPAVRRNLARVARQSKVGTKADPVTLYKQRQELQQKMIKNAAERSRRKADRGARPSAGLIWDNGQAVGWGGPNEHGHGGDGRGREKDRRYVLTGGVGVRLR